jgi:hypothetical protein
MYLKNLSIFFILLLTASFWSCSSSTECEDETKCIHQTIIAYAYFNDYYYDSQSGMYIDDFNTSLQGQGTGDPLPDFVHLKLNDSTFSGNDYIMMNCGYFDFGYNYYENIYSRITSGLDTLSVEVKTSTGTLNCTINLPDSITGLSIVPDDTLHPGQDLTVYWTGGTADFYNVYSHYFVKNDSGYFYKTLNEFVAGNSITFPASCFEGEGRIYYVHVTPINGTLPEVGAVCNMSGEGNGFLYYFERTEYHHDDIIISGGTSTIMKNTSVLPPTEKEVNANIRDKIKSIIN